MKTKVGTRIVSVDEKLSYAHSVPVDINLTRLSVKEILDTAAAESGDKTAFIFPHNFGLELSFNDVQAKVMILAENLLRMGFKKGDRLALAIDNTFEVVITFLACAIIGVVVTLFSPNFKLFEFEHLLKKTGAKGLVIFDSIGEKNFIEIMNKLCPEMESSEKGQLISSTFPDLEHIIVINRSLSVQTEDGQERPSVGENLVRYAGCWSYEDIATEKLEDGSCEWPYVAIDDLLFISFTVRNILWMNSTV